MIKSISRYLLICCAVAVPVMAWCCTSAIVAGRLTRDGNMLLWKHRDTSAYDNVVDRIAATDSTMAYVALYNAADTLRHEAWIGMNESGFAVMNTASYNLVPDTASFRDQEGIVMTKALGCCRSVADFERLLSDLPRPMGVQANFGVIDADGVGAYFETFDTGFRRFDINDGDTPGLLVRTNYSESGKDGAGLGYIRYDNALHLLDTHIAARDISPEVLTEELSRSFYHSVTERDMSQSADDYIVDLDFIPRYSSTASVVIEAVPSPSGDGSRYVMWCVLGYPPCSHVVPVTVDSVPPCLTADPPTGRAPRCDESRRLKDRVFPIVRGNGRHYIYMPALREISDAEHRRSVETYRSYKKNYEK